MPALIGRTAGGGRLGTRIGRSGAAGANTYGYLRGASDLVRALDRLDRGLSDEALARATLAGAEVLREAWQERVPIDDGNYRDGITALASPGKVGATAVVFPGDVPGLPDDQQPRNYAARLEFGSARQTKKQAQSGTFVPGRGRGAQPSLRPAFDSVAGKMVDAMGDEVRHLIEQNS